MVGRRITAALFGVFLALLGTALVAGPAHAGTAYNNIQTSYGTCLDVRTQDNTSVQELNCKTVGGQQWRLERVTELNDTTYWHVRNEAKGWCLTTAGSQDPSKQLQVLPCAFDPSQMWQDKGVRFGGQVWSNLVNLNSGMCADLRFNSSSNGTVVQQYYCNGTTAQLLFI